MVPRAAPLRYVAGDRPKVPSEASLVMRLFLCVAAVVLLLSAASPTAPPTKAPAFSCPCEDTSLCKPLSPQPPPRDEVFAFTSWVFNGEQPIWQNYSLKQNRIWTAPEHLDWGKITTLAPFDDVSCAGPYHQAYAKTGNNSDYASMFCKAHAQNARILTWGKESWDGRSCPVTEFYSWLLKSEKGEDPERIYNQSAVSQWAQEVASCVPERGFDGVMLDIEGVSVPTTKVL